MKNLFVILILIITTQLTGAEVISLEKSIELARENNREMLATEELYHASVWAERNALSGFFPRLDFNSTIARIDDDYYREMSGVDEIPVYGTDGQIIGTIPFSAAAMSPGFYKTTYNNNITVQQPIFNGGKEIFSYQLARLLRNQSKQELLSKEKTLDYEVTSVYFGFLKLQDLYELARKNLNSTSSHLDLIQQRYELGTVKKSDLLQWQVRFKNDQTSLQMIENDLREITELWGLVLDFEDDYPEPKPFDVSSYDDNIKSLVELDEKSLHQELNDFYEKVKQTSPEIRSMQINKKMMRKNYHIALSNFLPNFNLQFTYEFENDDEFDLQGQENWSLAAVVSVPIFYSGSNYAKVKQSWYEWRSAEKNLNFAQDSYLISAKNVFYEQLINAHKVQDSKSALELAQENHRIVNDLYEQGMVTNIELLDAETMLINSEFNLISAYYDFILNEYELKKYICNKESK